VAKKIRSPKSKKTTCSNQLLATKNDKKANWLIWYLFNRSIRRWSYYSAVTNSTVNLGFDVHIFATANAAINTIVAILLVAALVAVRKQRYRQHKKLMIAALVLSVLFLLSYVTHRLFAGESRFGDANHDGVVSDAEIAMVSTARLIYFIILSTHIILAGIADPSPHIIHRLPRPHLRVPRPHKNSRASHGRCGFMWRLQGPVVYFMISPVL
jgi:putative membrane protein